MAGFEVSTEAPIGVRYALLRENSAVTLALR